MRKTLAWMAVVLAVGMTMGMQAEAKRLAGGKSAGMQRQSVTAPAQPAGAGAPRATPGQVAPAAGSTAAAAAPAAAATAKRSWMGPLAGLAAGLGIAALASHFGFGEALANMMTFALVAMAVMALIGFLLRRRATGSSGAFAGAGASAGTPNAMASSVLRDSRQVQDVPYRAASPAAAGSLIGSRLDPGADATGVAGAAGHIPTGFDTAGFERIARDQFMALQSANDARDIDRLRDCLSPEMFGIVRAEIAERGAAAQQTEVFGLTAQVVDVAEEADRYVVSVRYTGSIREQAGAVPDDLDEVWHLTKARQGSGGWVIAGIQQAA